MGKLLVHVILLLLEGGVDDGRQGLGLLFQGFFGSEGFQILFGCQLLELLVEVLLGELGHGKGIKDSTCSLANPRGS